MTQNTPKHVSLRESLLEEVTQQPPGTRLKPIKEIMEIHGVSQATVDRALGFLRQKGYIESFVGRGTFVTKKVAASANTAMTATQVDLIRFSGEQEMIAQGFFDDLLSNLNELLGRSEKMMRLTTLPRDANAEMLLEKVRRMETRAAILLQPFTPTMGEALLAEKIPFVQVIPHWPINLPNSIHVDNREIVRQWFECLTSHGHENIAYLHGVIENVYNRDMSERLLFFYEEAVRRNIHLKPEYIIQGPAYRQGGYNGMKELLSKTRDFTAVIINDHCAAGVYDALAEEDLTVGQDVSVIGTDDLVWTSHLSPPLTTVRQSRRQLARTILRHLEELQTGEQDNFEPEYFPVRLIERESVCSPSD